MTPVARRVFLYWLLMLLPTLAAGVGALWLLHREQLRLDEQTRAATDSRKASIQARARLIAENVELFVGEVQSGLMGTLRDAPLGGADSGAFLDEWERSNPLVRSTFRIVAETTLVRPNSGSSPQNGRGWLEALLSLGAPWSASPKKEQASESLSEREKRRDVSSNVANFQRARSEIQDVATMKSQAPAPAGEVSRATIERTGWTPFRNEGVLHLIGWRVSAAGNVIGVEVNLEEVGRRLADLLPTEGDMADAFVLRVTGGREVYAKDTKSLAKSSYDSLGSRERGGIATTTVPIAATLLPGWEVATYMPERAVAGGTGRSFFFIGALLVATFVATILAGGTLLVGQARRSEREATQKTSFVANVSHEFKTPLTTIRLYAELLEQGRVRDALQRDDYLRIIGAETERLARLVNNALDFSRLEQGQKKYACVALDLSTDVGRLLDTYELRMAELGLKLHREFPAETIRVVSDRDALEQVLLNLLDNACKYACGGGEVTVSIRAAKTGAVIIVADRGPGVPSEHRIRIFEKFHRVDDALTAEKAGAGLGLSIARQLARGLGGDLRFEPRPGGGSHFILEIA